MVRISNRTASASTLVVMALVLGGCQMLGIGDQRVTRTSIEADPSILNDFGSDQLAEGRQALSDGRTAEAINAFMLAKSFQQHAPAAYNGLAVAYSRLGREDLAERFFLTAVALAPQDNRYRSNLARFYVHNGMPRATGRELAIAPGEPVVDEIPRVMEETRAAAVEAPASRELRAGVTASAPVSRLHRISAAEVRIGSGVAAPSSAAPSGRQVVVVVGRGSAEPGPAARFALAPRERPAAALSQPYPIRIPLGD